MMDLDTDRISGDLEQLARMCRCKEKEMAVAVEELRASKTAAIVKQNGSIIIISKKRQREMELRVLRQKSGSTGGSSSQAQRELLKEFCSDFATPASYSDSDSSGVKEGGMGETPPDWMSGEDFKLAWSEWETHRKEIGKPITPLASKKLLKQCASMGRDRAISAINHSIARQWRGIFEDKNAETVAANGGVGRTPVRPHTKRESWQIENDIKSVRAQQEKVLDVSRYGYTDGFLKLHKMADGGDVRAVEDLAAWHRLKERKVALESELRSL